MQEIWEPIRGYEGLYEVSNFGNVKSLPRKGTRTNNEYLLKKCTYKTGYEYVLLSNNNKKKKHKIHRLVADAFIPNPNNYPCVNHIDENKQNNNVQNLEWCTVSYNNRYSKAKKVLQYDRQNKLLKIWESTRDVERNTKFSHSYISKCCRNKNNKEWRYESEQI